MVLETRVVVVENTSIRINIRGCLCGAGGMGNVGWEVDDCSALELQAKEQKKIDRLMLVAAERGYLGDVGDL